MRVKRASFGIVPNRKKEKAQRGAISEAFGIVPKSRPLARLLGKVFMNAVALTRK